MFKKTKSYFLILLFNQLNEKRTLKTIKYNKDLQQKLYIKMIHYKIFSGKFITYESNNEGKEYICYNNELLFEGEYKNGERNGKGKEYNNYGQLIFEGDYKNGKRWNGKFHHNRKVYEIKIGKGHVVERKNDNEKFEGEYLNGERNGK